MDELNINELIEKAQDLISDDKVSMADKVQVPIQKIKIDGLEFFLSFVLQRIYEPEN